MQLWEALKIYQETGRKIRMGSFSEYYKPYQFGNTLAANYDSSNWEVEPVKVEVTREQLMNTFDKVCDKYNSTDSKYFRQHFKDLCKELGLD